MAWRCPYDRCEGNGFVYDEATNTARDCDCREQMIAASRTSRLRARLPNRYANVSFDTPPVTDMPRAVVRGVQRYVNELDTNLEQGLGLWFEGPSGTGKTTLAMLVSKTAIAAGKTVAIYSVPRILNELRDTFDDDAPMRAGQLIDRLAAVDLLHLDDLGAERSNPWVLEQLYAIVDARYEAERAVLITTNLAHDDLVLQIGARTVSRLSEMCKVIPLHGADQRMLEGNPDLSVAAPPRAEWNSPAPGANLQPPHWAGAAPAPGGAPDPAGPPSWWDRRDPWPPVAEGGLRGAGGRRPSGS